MEWLKGKKTYLLAAALATVALVYRLDLLFNDNPATLDVLEVGWLSQPTYDMLKLMFGGGGMAALGAKVERLVSSK